ncbi:hypothetical protein T459_35182 [Capsicum annuum]|uniref:Copia protein n=1 Tax=Capsicum annuum TaxID=4072 RepID=A0A2G2XTY8_CAPAN|nr:hypothetical protein T459_35182 [Capsicum annuum]
MGQNLTSWTAKKQSIVARSSTKAEYRSVANTTAEIIWPHSLLQELKQPTHQLTIIWCDNIGVSYLAVNLCFKAQTKHVEVDFHFVREQVKTGHISLQFISSIDQLANIFTKYLSTSWFQFIKGKLRILDKPS